MANTITQPLIPHEAPIPNKPMIPQNYKYCEKHNWYYSGSEKCDACADIYEEDSLDDLASQLEGTKFDEDKLRWDLLPIVPVEKIVEIITHGAKKYAPENWKKVNIMRFYAAAMRHITAWKKGEEFDKDSGFTHLAHVGCNILFMMWIEENKVRTYPEKLKDLEHLAL